MRGSASTECHSTDAARPESFITIGPSVNNDHSSVISRIIIPARRCVMNELVASVFRLELEVPFTVIVRLIQFTETYARVIDSASVVGAPSEKFII